MVETKFFDFEEAKFIAHKYIEETDIPEEYRHMLKQIDSRYDYIFDILEHDIRSGDI